ncbi:hypothetical protein [Martelella mangrovi]|uniref:hypothetical protein n=1 Tax=Martelella mangrovi TaxID=1397477 RepID=UPI003392A219
MQQPRNRTIEVDIETGAVCRWCQDNLLDQIAKRFLRAEHPISFAQASDERCNLLAIACRHRRVEQDRLRRLDGCELVFKGLAAAIEVVHAVLDLIGWHARDNRINQFGVVVLDPGQLCFLGFAI